MIERMIMDPPQIIDGIHGHFAAFENNTIRRLVYLRTRVPSPTGSVDLGKASYVT